MLASHRLTRAGRTLGALGATGLIAGSLTLLSTGTAQAATPTPQVTAAEQWTRATLIPGSAGAAGGGGLLPSSFGGANYGASADAIISLEAVGDTSDASAMAAALQAQLDSYISGAAFGDSADSVYAGSAAKAAVALAAAGIDQPDLIASLETTVQSSGRIQDTSDFGDFENVLGQAFAVNALTAAGSSDAAAATTFLLGQQCDGGWFRESFTESTGADGNQVGTDKTCDADPKSSPSVDATATAVLNLMPQLDTSAPVARSIGRAESWLLSMQHADGGWGDASVGGTSNANSTGLVVRALGALGHTAAAQRGAAWLRGNQLTNAGSCTPYAAAARGAIGYDHAAWSAAQKGGTSASLDQFVVAASQALPALSWAPTTTGSPTLSGPTSGFHTGGSKVTLSVKRAQPGGALCVTTPAGHTLLTAGASGTASLAVTLPKTTRSYRVSVASPSPSAWTGSLTFDVLAAKKLFPKVSARTVKLGAKETVTVNGLGSKEKVTIKLRSTKVASGTASTAGVYRATFTVKGSAGSATLTATGQFANRTGGTAVKVVRSK